MNLYSDLDTTALILELQNRGYTVSKKDPNTEPKKAVRPPTPKPIPRGNSKFRCHCGYPLCPICNQ